MKDSIILDKLNHHDILFNNSIDPILLIHGYEFVDCNNAALKIFNIDDKKQLFQIHPSYLSPKLQEDGTLSINKANEYIKEAYKKGSCRFEWLHKTIDNINFWAEVTLMASKIHNEDVLYVSLRDIQKRKSYENSIQEQNTQLKEKNNYINQINTILKSEDKTKKNLIENLSLLNEYKKAIDESSIVSKTNLKGIITYVNDKFCSITGYSKEELIGQNHNIIRHPDNPKSIYKELWQTISNKKVFKSIMKNRKKNGDSYYVDSTIIPILDENDEIKEFIGIRHDVSSSYEKDKIIYKQNTDELTNLPNRSKLLRDIKNLNLTKLAIIDIDSFKDFNDSYGLETGDEILKQCANELLKFENKNLSVYRISGDLFALLGKESYSLEQLNQTCEQIIKHLDNTNFIVNEDHFDLSVTIGIAKASSTPLAHTEMALYHAKKKNLSICVFNDKLDIQEKLKTNIDFTQKIKHSIKNDGILMYGQKIFNNKTNSYKYETLMRMKLKDGTIISPFKFLDHAKKAKLYPSMTKIMIKKACEYFKDTDFTFSINLTLQDITNKDTVNFLIEKLSETKTSNQAIIELVESEGIEKFEEVSAFINKIKDIGCKIAIDDFGTGYSNFEYLIKLNVDILKLDGSLIKNLDENDNLFMAVSTIVDFSKKLNIQTVAEFVHSEEILSIVKSLQINHSQGFYLHEPELLA